VIVTGAAQGIGKACALRFATEGARIVVADRADREARATVDEILAGGSEAVASIVDLETSDGARQLITEAINTYGQIDVSVHNVGGTIWAKPFWDYADEEIEKEIRRSLWPTLWCCRAVIPHMRERRQGAIVNVGSVATRGINRVPYSAAKGGVEAITACLAMELADDNIRVNCVAPGGVDVGERSIQRNPAPPTEADASGMAAVVEQTLRDTPMKRFSTPDEQASAIAFLASDEASYITGQTLFVAGGVLARPLSRHSTLDIAPPTCVLRFARPQGRFREQCDTAVGGGLPSSNRPHPCVPSQARCYTSKIL
jgi:dihydroxycyclohexadiene carboxylate dehydrogenase